MSEELLHMMFTTLRSALHLKDKNILLSKNDVCYQRFHACSPIDGPLFKRRKQRGDGPITAQHLIEQSVIAMGDPFQLNYLRSPLLLPSVVLQQAAAKLLLIFQRC